MERSRRMKKREKKSQKTDNAETITAAKAETEAEIETDTAAENGSTAEPQNNNAEPAVMENAEPVTAADMTEPAAAAVPADSKPSPTRKHIEVKAKKISYERKKRLYGYGFIALWLIGTIRLFIIPIIQSIIYSFKDAMVYDKESAWQAGYLGAGVNGPWNNFSNYITAFTGDQQFPVALVNSIGEIIPKAFVIMIFSLFIAVILNQKFRGRTLARAIFFLPVLIATGPVISVINGDIANQGVTSAAQFSTLFRTDLVGALLEFIGFNRLNPAFITFIETITSDVLNLVWNSGIQILIFLSALQNIPVSAKESADIEGATGWEFFWKITFPLISPMILANLMYTIIDAFVSTDNEVMALVLTYSRNGSLGYSAALAWIYFAVIAAILAIIAVVCNRFVYYETE